ncbi:hypothetical protein EON78_00725 [bacterium]|nr:MAG: hypothetical protein EON78_00725 [bacterium]
MSIYNLTLVSYFVIKDQIATEADITNNILASLCKDNDYVIEKYKEEARKDGNYRFVFKTYNSKMNEAPILINGWAITEITSNLCWKPHLWMSFNLTDSEGNSSKDNKMPYTNSNDDYFRNSQDLKVEGVSFRGINRMIELAQKASAFKSWYYFLENLSLQKASLDFNDKLRKLETKTTELLKAIQDLYI